MLPALFDSIMHAVSSASRLLTRNGMAFVDALVLPRLLDFLIGSFNNVLFRCPLLAILTSF